MKRLQKIVGIVFGLLGLWAFINPFIFTFSQSDESAINTFRTVGWQIDFEDYRYNKNNLHIARIGDTSKPVLLFLHGSPGCWNAAWDYFKDSSWQNHYELISIDRPGFGKSDYGKAQNLFDQSEIISAFVKDRLQGRKIHLLGHSYGGPLVLQLCADNDTLYDKCFILAGSVNPQAEKEEWQLNLFSNTLLKWMVPGAFEQGVEELLWLKDDLRSARYLEGLTNIKTTIVGIYGTKDGMVPYQSNVDFLKDSFPSSQLEICPIQGANHFLPWENYDEVKQLILKAQ